MRSLSATAPASTELLPMRGMTTGCERQPAKSWHASRISASPAAELWGEVPSGWGFLLEPLEKLKRPRGTSADDWQGDRRSTEMVINALVGREAD